MHVPKQYQYYIKRFFDLMIIVLLLIVLSPILFLIGFLARMRIGMPTIFCQERPGLHGSLFTIYKFSTMTDV